ncbi:MAG: UDP-N-acetylmuramoyl-tripeptide--D-alanyl-D-alanine ligase [Truepera sp.]|nr:UDP-N-acetylmuramoyl-tripeptide--D-alanyl-D-alanine ligase [Truepera sp.]
MPLLSVRALVRLLNTVEPVEELPDATGIAFDSRSVRPGDAFFALPGASGHGIDFAGSALERGAAFVVSDRPHRRGLLVDDARGALLALGRAARERLSAPVIAVSGSAGKTSTKAMLAAALQARTTPGNLNTHFALARLLVDAALEDEETPSGGAPLVLELGIDHPGEMAELVDLTRPDHAALTAIAASHLSALGDVAGVAREKTLLLDRTPGVTVAAADAAAYLGKETLERTVVVSVGRGDKALPAGARASVVGVSAPLADGALLTWEAGGERASATLPWPGRAMAQNALIALTMARELGVTTAAAVERVRQARLEPGRLERLRLQGVTLLDDSYNSNPASLEEALAVLREAPAPRAAFLADMLELGTQERGAHLRAGELSRGIDLVVAVGRASAALLETNPEAVRAVDALAASDLLGRVPKGATVLVKGSRSMGMERLAAAIKERAARGTWATTEATAEAAAVEPC